MVTPPTLQIDRSLRRSLRVFDRDRLRWLDEAASRGTLVNLKLGPASTWIVTDPDIARTVLVTDAEQWRRPPSAVIPIRLGVGENLFTQSDKHWSILQPLLSPVFRKRTLAPRVANLSHVIGQHTSGIQRGQSIDLEALTNRIALAVASWVLFGEELATERADELAGHNREVVAWVGERIGQLRSIVPFATGSKARWMKRHRAALDRYADEVITRARRSPPDPDSVLAALLNARPNGSALREGALRGHVLGLLLAGNETTSTALSWAMVHGARNPTQWAKVRTDPMLATSFAEETLRLTPAVWGFARSSTKANATLATGGVIARVRRREIVTVYLRGMNRDPILWPDPTTFRPERHADTSAEQQRALLPFGLGPRSCIGQHLALFELHHAIPALTRLGNIELESEPRESPSFTLGFTSDLRGRFVNPPA